MKLPALWLVALKASAAPLTPEQELATFQFADPELRIELVAAEPQVISPVAITFDAAGRMFVAEMMDYPLGPEGGQIRCLEDRDADGHFETATVYATNLAYPNGVLPWDGGVLVTAAPDIIFLKDKDGDNRADTPRVLLTGFGKGNQQLRVNGLMWGLDNYVYGANGRSDGEIRPRHSSGGRSLRGYDFRFRPEWVDFQGGETLAGRSQFGLTRDDWGNRFLSWNTIFARHEVIPKQYFIPREFVFRDSYFSGNEGVFDITQPGDTGEVFPLTPAPLTFNKESTSHFNALAGLTIYRGDALGADYYGDVFAGESLRNLVHRRKLVPDGVTFVAKRIEQRKEFMASTDPWFHPVNFATGPDGALYVVDFYRHFVEHPDYVPEKLRSSQPWQSGAEHGRIWRIARKGVRLDRRAPRLDKATPAELVSFLKHTNAWWRDTTHRLLVELHPDKVSPRGEFKQSAAIPMLQAIVRDSATNQPLPVLHALWILNDIGGLTRDLLSHVLDQGHPIVREHAIRLTETRAHIDKELGSALTRLDPNRNPRLALQLILSLAQLPLEDGARSRVAQLGVEYVESRWHSLGLLAAMPHLLDALANTPFFTAPTEAQKKFLQQVSPLIARGNAGRVLSLLAMTPSASSIAHLALIPGIGESLRIQKRALSELLNLSSDKNSSRFSGQFESLRRLPPEAVRIASDETAAVIDRVIALRALRHLSPENAAKILMAFLKLDQPSPLQEAAADEIAALFATRPQVFTNWNQWARGIRTSIIRKAVQSAPGAVIDALERQIVHPFELDASAREALRRSGDPRAQKLLVPATDRDDAVRRFQAALTLPGNAAKGRVQFEAKCLVCHNRKGQGTSVGPDLSGISARPREALAEDILAPGRQVAPDYAAYTIMLDEAETQTGLIVGENEAAITLRRPNEPDQVISRTRIREVRAEGKSLMPDGLEEGMTFQDFADLLAYLVETP